MAIRARLRGICCFVFFDSVLSRANETHLPRADFSPRNSSRIVTLGIPADVIEPGMPLEIVGHSAADRTRKGIASGERYANTKQ